MTPEMMKLFNQSMLNAAGKVETQAEYAGSMIDLGVQVRQAMSPPTHNPTVPLTIMLQIFTRIDPPTSAAEPDTHFNYFTKGVLPSLPRSTSTSTLIFIPSYFDLIRMRNHLHNTPISVWYHLGRKPGLLHRARTVTFLHRPSLGSSLQCASAPLPPLRHLRSHERGILRAAR